MALGGGNFLTQNKVLNGTYINFVSAGKSSASLSDRGVAAVPLILDWGIDGAVFTVTAEDFQKDSLKIFGYSVDAPQLKALRELFRNISVGHFYKLMNTGVAAANTYCTAKYKGVRGNDLKTVIAVNLDDNTKMDVSTYLGTVLVDKQTVLPNSDKLADNDYVIWKGNVTLAATAALPLTAGSNGTGITTGDYQVFLDHMEAYSFNVLACPTSDTAVTDLFIAFTKRLRDQVGAKFQTVVYKKLADYEGVITVENTALDDVNPAALVYWVSGAEAACPVNKSLTNKRYDGEYEIGASFKQSDLEAGIKAGKFIFHKMGSELRVLDDINSYVTFTEEKSADFSSNQTVRVLDQFANDIALLFNKKYLGQIPNDPSGRISFWNDLVDIHKQMEKIRAIEAFKPSDIKVEKGETKKSVIVNNIITPVNAMGQLYMTMVVE